MVEPTVGGVVSPEPPVPFASGVIAIAPVTVVVNPHSDGIVEAAMFKTK